MKQRVVLPLIAVLLAVLAACGGESDSDELTIFATSSLTDAFERIAGDFEQANPGLSVTLNFAGSQELRTQLEQGAQADVFASADQRQMQLAHDAGVVEADSRIFAHNRLVIIVPAGNPADVASPEDLAAPGLRIVFAAEEVPAGRYARDFLANADGAFGPGYADAVLSNVVSEESNVRQVAVKVQLGEADAGIVYLTDVHGDLADDVTVIDIPDDLNVTAEYVVGVTTDARSPEAVRAFIDYLLGEGQLTLTEFGFQPAEQIGGD